jgi:hypothetical protein
MAGEGDLAGAERVLEAGVAANPGWLEGHQAL